MLRKIILPGAFPPLLAVAIIAALVQARADGQEPKAQGAQAGPDQAQERGPDLTGDIKIDSALVLNEWKYPGARDQGGGGGSGGAGVGRTSQYHHMMDTHDSFKDVAKYYEKKFGVPLTGNGPTSERVKRFQARQERLEPGERFLGIGQTNNGSSTVIQEDSARRPVKLMVFVQHRGSSSITLVISRGEGEDRTHIAWSYYEAPR